MRIDTNIGFIDDQWVEFHFTDPYGRTTIRLPRNIVPKEILAYGQAVRITLTSEGIQIEKRNPILQRDDFDIIIDKWLDSLNSA